MPSKKFRKIRDRIDGDEMERIETEDWVHDIKKKQRTKELDRRRKEKYENR